MNGRDTLDAIFRDTRTIAVVGLSPKPWRESFGVARALQGFGYRIVPVNPNADTILGETAYRSLTDAAREHRIDCVNIFRNSEDVPPVVDEAIAIGAKSVWMQVGIEHPAAAAKAEAAGLRVVQDACIKVERACWTPRRTPSPSSAAP